MTHSATALIIDDERDICELLSITLNRMNITPVVSHSFEDACHKLKTQNFSLCLTDMRLGSPEGDGLDIVSLIQDSHPDMPVAVITAHGTMDAAIEALKRGAFDFISKPIDVPSLRNLVLTALKLGAPMSNNRSDQNPTENPLLGESSAMLVLKQLLTKIARSQAPVYISGPSGSGKELVARIIHDTSPRAEYPFVPVNCGAIPRDLMESEFFGHLKGSFTGAIKDKEGLFQAAHKGTLFLDEVADLPLDMQVKLLRAIQEKAIRPVGSTKELAIDVRILSATNQALFEKVQQGAFRQDLFYRLNVIELKVPSLVERQQDIPLLCDYILNKIAAQSQSSTPNLSAEAITQLCHYTFPGNVRELENILERAFTLCDGKTIQPSDLQLPCHSTLPTSLDPYLGDLEKNAILEALEHTQGNKTQAAKLLGISFRTLRYRLKKLEIS